MFSLEIHDIDIILGLSTGCSRFPKNVALRLSKSCSKVVQKRSKVAFRNESCSKVAPKKQKDISLLSSLIWSGEEWQKYAN